MDEVIESNKRGAKLCHAGYMYTKTCVRKNKIWWKCSKRTSLNCCASVSTSLDAKNPVPRILHNHKPEEAEVEYAKYRNRMRTKRFEEETTTPTNPLVDDEDEDTLQQQIYPVDNQKNTFSKINNTDNNINPKRKFKCLFRRRKKENSKKHSAKDLTEGRNRFFSGAVRQTPNLMTFQRLNQFPAPKSLSLPSKRPQLTENGQNLFPHLQMNFSTNTSAKFQGMKRPNLSHSLSRGELEDVKPCKRQLDAQSSIHLDQTHSQMTTNHHTYSQLTSPQQIRLPLPTNHSNHRQQSTSHQSNQITSNQLGHSQITIVSQNHHVTTSQLNHQVSTNHQDHLKANTMGHPKPYQVLTGQQGHQMRTAQKNHQNVSMSPANPHKVTTDQPRIADHQTQPQITTAHQKRHQLGPTQLQFQETVSNHLNRIEGATGQQRSETLQDSLKPASEISNSSLKQISTLDSMSRTSSSSKTSSTPQKKNKTFTVSKHQHTVMSSLASLWKDSKLCDATIGNGNFKIMVHKVVLLAISPKLLSQANIKANCFIRVNLPEEISEEALVSFSEYMYHGVLTLDPNLLQQLRIIALQLGIRELELLCDTHLLYCEPHNPTVNSDLNLPETTHSSPLISSTLTNPSQASSVMQQLKTAKQEAVREEISLTSSQCLLKDLALPIKMEPADAESSSCIQNIFNNSISTNSNNDLASTKYPPPNLEGLLLNSQNNKQVFHSMSSDFESPTIPLHQGPTDSLLEFNDILQLQKFFKNSDRSNFIPDDTFDKSIVSLLPNSCDDIVDHETACNKNDYGVNTTDSLQQNFEGQSKSYSAVSTNQRTSQPLEVLKENAELLTFQITDIRSVQQAIDIT